MGDVTFIARSVTLDLSDNCIIIGLISSNTLDANVYEIPPADSIVDPQIEVHYRTSDGRDHFVYAGDFTYSSGEQMHSGRKCNMSMRR